MTPRTQSKLDEQKNPKEIWRHVCVSKNIDDEIKNIATQVLTYNSKNFQWLNKKTIPRMDCDWIGKTI